MSSWIAIFAEGEATQQAPAPGWTMWLPFAFLGLMVLMFFRASSKQKKQMQQALAGLKKNDKVVTSAGIIGVVVAVKDNEDEVTLKVDDTTNSRIRILRSSIVKIVSGDQVAGEVKP